MLEVIPDNAETLCMKGLLLNLTDKKEEGLDLAKKVFLILYLLGFDEKIEQDVKNMQDVIIKARKIRETNNISLK